MRAARPRSTLSIIPVAALTCAIKLRSVSVDAALTSRFPVPQPSIRLAREVPWSRAWPWPSSMTASRVRAPKVSETEGVSPLFANIAASAACPFASNTVSSRVTVLTAAPPISATGAAAPDPPSRPPRLAFTADVRSLRALTRFSVALAVITPCRVSVSWLGPEISAAPSASNVLPASSNLLEASTLRPVSSAAPPTAMPAVTTGLPVATVAAAEEIRVATLTLSAYPPSFSPEASFSLAAAAAGNCLSIDCSAVLVLVP